MFRLRVFSGPGRALRSLRDTRALAYAGALGAAFWLLESWTGAYVFRSGTFTEQLLRPAPREALLRLEVLTLLLFLCLFARRIDFRGRQTVEILGRVDAAQRRIEEQKEGLRKALGEAERQARESGDRERAKSRLLATLSHEVRTPLNGILGMAEATLRTDLTAEQREFLETVRTSGESLLRIVNDVLDFSRMEAGKIDVDRIPFSLRDCVSDTARALSSLATKKGLELGTNVHPDVPDAVAGDPGRIRQVLVNLLANAIKYTDRGRVTVRVQAELDASTGAPGNVQVLRFSVFDTGVGISPDRLDTVFDAFTRVAAAGKRATGGTGLGLAICRQLVERMGGRIWVESCPGRGTAFHFTLPVGLRGEGAEEGPPPEGALRGQPVLVVGKDRERADAWRRSLSDWSLEPTLAGEGDMALKDLRAAQERHGSPVLVILDSPEAGVDGFDLAERIRQDPALSRSRVILLRANGERGDAARCRELGIAGYLTHPVRPEDLLEAIVTVVGKSRTPDRPLVTRHTLRENRRRCHILLAEDDAFSRKVALLALEQTGHRVVTAEDGIAALACFEREVFDLVLMDIEMPRMNGLETTTAIREREENTGRRVPVIALTGHAGEEERRRCFRAGLDGCLVKPVTVAALHETLDEFLGAGTPSRAAEWRLGRALGAPADLDRIRSVARGDVACERELIELFLEQTEERVVRLRAALERRDPGAVGSVAHELKGATATIGAWGMEAAAASLEAAAGRHGLENAGCLGERLESEHGRVRRQLEGYLSSPRFAAAGAANAPQAVR